MKHPKKGKIGGYIPREWLVKGLQKLARDYRKLQREKDIEIKQLKLQIKGLKNEK